MTTAERQLMFVRCAPEVKLALLVSTQHPVASVGFTVALRKERLTHTAQQRGQQHGCWLLFPPPTSVHCTTHGLTQSTYLVSGLTADKCALALLTWLDWASPMMEPIGCLMPLKYDYFFSVAFWAWQRWMVIPDSEHFLRVLKVSQRVEIGGQKIHRNMSLHPRSEMSEGRKNETGKSRSHAYNPRTTHKWRSDLIWNFLHTTAYCQPCSPFLMPGSVQ